MKCNFDRCRWSSSQTLTTSVFINTFLSPTATAHVHLLCPTCLTWHVYQHFPEIQLHRGAEPGRGNKHIMYGYNNQTRHSWTRRDPLMVVCPFVECNDASYHLTFEGLMEDSFQYKSILWVIRRMLLNGIGPPMETR